MSNSAKTIIISDIHLGSTLSSAEAVLTFLKKTDFKRLILLGDIFDGIHLYRFKEIDWDLLNYLKKLEIDGKEVVWIKGNHDTVDGMDINFVDSYEWQDFGKKCLAIHGHQFDYMAIKNPSLKKLTGTLHSLFAAYMRNKKLARFFERAHTNLRGLSQIVSKGAMDYAVKNNIDYIFCGHTHVPMQIDGYFNTGSWIHEPFTYISIDEDGFKIRDFVNDIPME